VGEGGGVIFFSNVSPHTMTMTIHPRAVKPGALKEKVLPKE